MSAKTKFYICGHCGFQNHPRQPPVGVDPQVYNTHCEQCGAGSDHPDAADYAPQGH
jgi:ribosomal protein S27AE